MAISTYTDLKTAIQNWTRDTSTAFSSRFDDITLLTEKRMENGVVEPSPFPTPPFRPRILEQRATASLTSEYLALPVDYLEMIMLKVNTATTTDEYFLDTRTPIQFERTGGNAQAGDPKLFTIVSSELRFKLVPSSATVEMWYYKKIPSLVTNSTNDILTASPNVYLYGCLLEAYIFKGGNTENVMKYGALYAGALNSLNLAQRNSRAGGTLVMRSDGSTP